MKNNPRYYVKHEKLTHQMTREAQKSLKRRSDLEKQREDARNSVTEAKRNRDRLLANPETQFVKSKIGTVIHHVSCEHIKEISDENFKVYDGPITSDTNVCSTCKRMIWIALGIEDQRSSIPVINSFFRYIRINNQMLQALFVAHKAKVRLLNNFQMQILLNGETWILTRTEENHKVRIFHNNYWLNTSGKRISMSGYHAQHDGKEMIGARAISSIIRYKKHSD